MAIGQYGMCLAHNPYRHLFIMSTAAATARVHRSSHHSEAEGLVARIKAEYREMPGLSLTRTQAQRLWQLDESTCRTILSGLVASGFLQLTAKGHYTRPQ